MRPQDDKIQNGINEYNCIIGEKASKQEEIANLKAKIMQLETECDSLDINAHEVENMLQAQVYQCYREKDLLEMVKVVEKHAKKEVAADFKNLVEMFVNHSLGVNDITQLHSYIKLFGEYVREEQSVLRKIFKTLGGHL